MNWKYFTGASLVVGFALWKSGAPLLPILLGISLAALFNFSRRSRISAR